MNYETVGTIAKNEFPTSSIHVDESGEVVIHTGLYVGLNGLNELVEG